jgi:DNA-directed RNA polymerase subunit RPC12/RpoP
MSIQIRCGCGTLIAAKDEQAGARVECPHCGYRLLVPARRVVPVTRRDGTKLPPSGIRRTSFDASADPFDLLFRPPTTRLDREPVQLPPLLDAGPRDSGLPNETSEAVGPPKPELKISPLWLTVGVLNLSIVITAVFVAWSFRAPPAPAAPLALVSVKVPAPFPVQAPLAKDEAQSIQRRI